MSRWTWLQWSVAIVGAAAAAAAVAIPSAVVSNPFFVRMTPVPWWSYAVWVASAVLSGLLLATFVRRAPVEPAPPARAGIVAVIGSVLAVGCPVCNKVIVAAVGVSGALNVWAPLQPVVGIVSLGLLGWALRRRLAAARSCPVPITAPATSASRGCPGSTDAGGQP